MKTLQELKREIAHNSLVSRIIHENGFGEIVRLFERRGWVRIVRAEEVIIGDVYGTIDGIIKIKDETDTEGKFWGEVLEPIHKDIKKGDVFEYSYEDLYVGDPKDVEALKDWIIDGSKHKNVDKINLHPTQEERMLFEKTLNDDEIEALIDKARDSALAIKKDRKRDKEEREQAKEVLDFIDDVEGIWDKKKSLHPSQVVSLMKIVAGTSSTNPNGWGWKTKGFSGSPSGKVPQDFSNEELTEGKMTDGIIKAGALMTKRYIINKGQEGDVSAQINGLASLILFSIAATDRGESFMSKALATSGFFKGATKR